jgi:hypothetical protein
MAQLKGSQESREVLSAYYSFLKGNGIGQNPLNEHPNLPLPVA